MRGKPCLEELKIKLEDQCSKDSIIIILNHDHSIINAAPQKIVEMLTKKSREMGSIVNKDFETYGINIISDKEKFL